VHKTSGQRDPAAAFPLPDVRDDAGDRRAANRAVAVSAIGLGATGLIELLLAVLTGSVGLLGDAIHNLSDVSTSAVVFLGFRLSRRPATERYPYGLERAEDLAGIGIAVVIWASAASAGYESIRKLIGHGHTTHVGAGIAGAIIGILGNLAVARYKLVVGRRINSATLVADARHSRLDALSSVGALAGLIAVASGQPGVTRSPGWPSPRSSGTSATRSPPMWCTASPTASTPRSSPPPNPPPGRCPVSCTPTPGPGGPGGPYGSKSKAGWTRVYPPGTPMRSAGKSPPPWPSSCPRQAASRGPAAQAPAGYYLCDGGARCPTAAKTAAMTMVSYRCGTTGLEHRPSAQPRLDGPGRPADDCRIEGHACCVPRGRPTLSQRGTSRYARAIS
jgi:hypothetical protein